jgi:UDP-N-acetylglucosamine:LPS N-acetylglucosamine transferase
LLGGGIQVTKILFLPFLQIETGHHKVADALIRSLASRLPDASLQKVDVLSFAYGKAEKLVSKIYLQWIDHWPQNYKHFYERLAYPSTSPTYLKWFEALLQNQMLRLIFQEQANLIICTHSYPSLVLNSLKERGQVTIPVINVYTDFFVNQIWGKQEIEYHFVPDSASKYELSTRYKIPEKRIIITGIPIDESFTYRYKPVRKKSCYKILIAGGNGGLGDIYTLLQKVKDSTELFFLVLCGSNKRLFEMLKSLRSNHIMPFPYLSSSAEVNYMYEQADAIITKPGGVTISEALQKRLPIFIHSTLPGQEEFNLKNLTSKGLVYTLDMDQPIGEQLLRVLNNESELSLFRKRVDQFYQNIDTRAWEKILKILNPIEEANIIYK